MFTKRKAKSLVAIASAISLIAGCSQGGGTSSAPANSTGGTKEAPTEISIMVTNYAIEPPTEDNIMIKEIEKRTNTKLKITWVSPNNYDEKVSVTLASGDMPDLMLIRDIFTPQVRQAATQGAFWEMTKLIPQYPNLKKMTEEAMQYSKLQDGKNYGIPRPRPTLGGSFPIVRKDWLDKLGLPIPKTMPEVYDVMKAFAEKDPDGNGKKDTYGALVNVEGDLLSYSSWPEEVYNKALGDWKLDNGKLVNINVLPGTRKALEFMKKAYEEKLIPEDFAILQRSQLKDMLYAGKGGIMKDSGTGAWRAAEALRKTVPGAEYVPLVSIDGYSPSTNSFYGMYVIPKKVPESKVKKILEFMDYGSTKEGYVFANYGLENVHYKLVDGNYEATEQATKDNISQQAFGQVFSPDNPYLSAYAPGIPSEMYANFKKIYDEKAKINVPDYTYGLYSETAIKVAPELRKKATDLKTQIMLGKKQLSDWDAFVEQLKKDPDLQKMTDEFNKAYQTRIASK